MAGPGMHMCNGELFWDPRKGDSHRTLSLSHWVGVRGSAAQRPGVPKRNGVCLGLMHVLSYEVPVGFSGPGRMWVSCMGQGPGRSLPPHP